MRLSSLAALTLLVGWAPIAMAGEDPAPEYTADQVVAAILNGPKPCPAPKTQEECDAAASASKKTRRWVMATGGESDGGVVKPQASKPARVARPAKPVRRVATACTARPVDTSGLSFADMRLTFALGSADLTPQSRANLKQIAVALKSKLEPLSFEVAGYTDATGADEVNIPLSEKRAAAVKDFLVAQGVAETRLKTRGFGAEHLALPDDPESCGNRRVEFMRLN